MIDAVFFDLFETLVTEWDGDKIVADYGSPADVLGISEDVFNREWIARRERRMNGCFPDYMAVLKDICASVGRSVDTDTLNVLYAQRTAAKLVPFDRIPEEILNMLKDIKRQKVKIGLISNCSSEEVEGLFSSSLGQLFDDVVLSFQVGVSKPDRGIYLLACERLAVEPGNSLFIGDGGSNELVGARAAGLHAYHATWFQPTFISEQLKGFPKLVRPENVSDFLG